MAKTQPDTIFSIIRKFRSRVDSFKGETRKSYRKALNSFCEFAYANFLYDEPLSPNLLREWYAFNRLKGLTPKMAYYYLDKVGNLYSTSFSTPPVGKILIIN